MYVYKIYYSINILDYEDVLTSPSSNYTNIKVQSKWNKRKIQQNGFSGKRLDDDMVLDISWAYNNYFRKQAAIIYNRIEFYQHISFIILDDDTLIKEDIKLQVGDVIEVKGKEDDDDDDDDNEK